MGGVVLSSGEGVLGKRFDEGVPRVADLVGLELGGTLRAAAEVLPEALQDRYRVGFPGKHEGMLTRLVNILEVMSEEVLLPRGRYEPATRDEALLCSKVMDKIGDGVASGEDDVEGSVVEYVHEASLPRSAARRRKESHRQRDPGRSSGSHCRRNGPRSVQRHRAPRRCGGSAGTRIDRRAGAWCIRDRRRRG
jgi:hypothetical protein